MRSPRTSNASVAPRRGRTTEQLPELEPAGIAAGLHLVAHLPADIDEAAVVDAAARRGLAVDGLARYRLGGAGRPGLVIGYAALSERDIADGVRLLAEAIAASESANRPSSSVNHSASSRPQAA